LKLRPFAEEIMSRAKKSRQVAPRVAEEATAVAVNVAGKAEDLARTAMSMASLSEARLRPPTDPLRRLTEMIRANPLTALLIGVAVGLVLAEATRQD
jgi:hypothetical protein